MNCFGMRHLCCTTLAMNIRARRRSMSSLKRGDARAHRDCRRHRGAQGGLLLGVGVLATDRGVHVGVGATRIRLPGPDMQLVERRQAVAIRRSREIEELTAE